MNILLTGASGFVGSAFINENIDKYKFCVIGRSRPDALKKSDKFYACDLNDPGDIKAVLENLLRVEAKFDLILHLAVSRLHRNFPETALDLFNVNTFSTAYLLDFARRSNAGHFVLGSTGSVYNGLPRRKMDENDIGLPKSYFAASKQAADVFATQYRLLFPVSILRFFVPYGPKQADRMLGNIADNIKNNKSILIPEKGDPLTFSAIYVDDVLSTINACVEHVWNDTVNVASNEAVTIVDAAKIIADILGTKARIETSSSAGSHYLVPNTKKLSQRIDMDAFTDLRTGITKMVHGISDTAF